MWINDDDDDDNTRNAKNCSARRKRNFTIMFSVLCKSGVIFLWPFHFIEAAFASVWVRVECFMLFHISEQLPEERNFRVVITSVSWSESGYESGKTDSFIHSFSAGFWICFWEFLHTILITVHNSGHIFRPGMIVWNMSVTLVVGNILVSFHLFAFCQSHQGLHKTKG